MSIVGHPRRETRMPFFYCFLHEMRIFARVYQINSLSLHQSNLFFTKQNRLLGFTIETHSWPVPQSGHQS